MKDVSVVIPTRNREKRLLNLLTNLMRQTYPLKEVIVVDSSDVPLDEEKLKHQFSAWPVHYLKSKPSVCAQRNLGIQTAQSPYVFLCDDDISLPQEYVSILMRQLENEKAGATSGLILQKNVQGKWVHQYPPKSFRHLLFTFIFQQSVWGEVDNLKVNCLVKPIYGVIKAFYRARKNTWSLAGWPLITNLAKPAFCSTIYGLGASIIKKEWLIHSPFEEVLDPHGIGDNYGVAVDFPQPVVVVNYAKAFHQQSNENRLDQSITYFRRILALHYFLKTKKRFVWWNRWWFAWSIFGNMVFHRNKKYRKASRVTLRLIILGKNPYLKAFKNGDKCVLPVFDHKGH